MGFDIGEHVGDYRITGVLGAGGCGEVYRAEHTITKREEALKTLAPGRAHTADEEQRFLREIQLHASLAHPNIASVHNAFSTKLGLVLAMELVEGESLEAMLERGRIPLETGIDYVLQVLSALGCAHANAVLHRDVKPGNIVIAADGTLKLTDFGLARQTAKPKLTQTGTPAGSPYYMSPEQVHGVGPVDARSDLYSTGAVLYEVVTGRRPFDGASAFEVMLAHVECAPAPPIQVEPAIGPALNQVILTALDKEPSRRFQSALEFRDALDTAKRDSRLARVEGRGRGFPRAKTLWAAAAALALGAIILAGVVRSSNTVRQREAQPAPPTAPVAVKPAEQVQPPPAAPPEAPATAVQVPVAEPAVPAQTREAEAVPKEPRRVRVAAAQRREPPILKKPKPVEEPVSESAGKPAEGAAVGAPEVPETIVDSAARPTAEPKAEEAPKKRGNRLWRALGRIARPWKSSAKKPDAEVPQEPQQ